MAAEGGGQALTLHLEADVPYPTPPGHRAPACLRLKPVVPIPRGPCVENSSHTQHARRRLIHCVYLRLTCSHRILAPCNGHLPFARAGRVQAVQRQRTGVRIYRETA